MADSFSTSLRLRLQQTGGNNNTWGSLLNTAALQLLEDAISGMTTVTIAGSDVTLSTANGANDQARYAILKLSGSPGATRSVIVPAVSKLYLVINGTANDQTVKVAGQTGVTVSAGASQLLYCDGTDVKAAQANPVGTVGAAADSLALGGFAAALYPRLDTHNVFTKGVRYPFVTATDGSTVTFDVAEGRNFIVTLAGNRTLAFANAADGAIVELWLKQDAGGNRTVTWPANVAFEGGVTPTLSAAAGAIDRFSATYNAAENRWIVRPGTRVGSGSAIAVDLQVGGSNQFLWDLAGRPSGIVTVDVTIARGVVITSTSPAAPALDCRGFASGSTVRIVNRGRILGRGGRGGRGGNVSSAGDDFRFDATAGEAGGTAILGPGAGITCTIENSDGYIWGGGGGGGGGGATAANGHAAAGGGGGGGAPFGSGGDAGTAGNQSVKTAGSIGLSAGIETAGTGGIGAATSGSGGTGGTGGTPGTAGSAGASPTSSTFDADGGAGGAAGKAIDQNGGTVTVLSGSSAPNLLGAVS